MEMKPVFTKQTTPPALPPLPSAAPGEPLPIDPCESFLRASERHFRAIVEGSDNAICVLDESGHIIYANEAICRLSGYSLEELFSRNLLEFMSEESRLLAADSYERHRGGEPGLSRHILSCIRKDGSRRDAELTVSSFRDTAGALRIVCHLFDITEAKRLEAALLKSEGRLRRITDNMMDLVIWVDPGALIEFVSPSVKRLLGYEIGEFIGRKFPDLCCAGNSGRFLSLLRRDAGDEASSLELCIRHKAGQDRWFEVAVNAIRNEAGLIIGAVLGGRDITDRKQKEEELRLSEERYRTILENIADGYFEVDLAGNLTFASEPCLRIMNAPWEGVEGINFRQYTPREDWPKVYESFFRVFTTGESLKGMGWDVIRLDGTRLPIEVSVSIIRDAQGRPVGFRGIVRDVTERKQADENVQWMAYHDLLTGLPNRALFYDRAAMILAQARRKALPFGVMMLDLDKFKKVNDTHGHDIGDKVLASVACRLKMLLRDEDTVARTGGDEFVILLPEVDSRASVEQVRQRILTAFTEPIALGAGFFPLSFSVGTALYPEDGDDIDALMRCADLSMYQFKAQGEIAAGS